MTAPGTLRRGSRSRKVLLAAALCRARGVAATSATIAAEIGGSPDAIAVAISRHVATGLMRHAANAGGAGVNAFKVYNLTAAGSRKVRQIVLGGF